MIKSEVEVLQPKNNKQERALVRQQWLQQQFTSSNKTITQLGSTTSYSI